MNTTMHKINLARKKSKTTEERNEQYEGLIDVLCRQESEVNRLSEEATKVNLT